MVRSHALRAAHPRTDQSTPTWMSSSRQSSRLASGPKLPPVQSVETARVGARVRTEAGVAEPLTWRELARMPSMRQEISTAVLDGKLFVIAGFDGSGMSTDTVEVYDPDTDTWSRRASLPSAR